MPIVVLRRPEIILPAIESLKGLKASARACGGGVDGYYGGGRCGIGAFIRHIW